MINKKIIYLFVEDPGALNYFIVLIRLFKKKNISYELNACGKAFDILTTNSENVKKLDKERVLSINWKNIGLLIVGTSENIYTKAFILIKNAKKFAVKTVSIVDSHINYEYRFKGISSNPLQHITDFILVPDIKTSDKYSTIGFEESRIFIIGYPSFNKNIPLRNREELRSKILKENPERKFIIVFASELSTGLNPENFIKNKDYTLEGRGKSKLRTNIIVEEFLDSIKYLVNNGYEMPYKILRKHPKEKYDDLGLLNKEFDYISQGEDPNNLLYASDLVVGLTSIILLQALEIGTPVFSILTSKKEIDWLPDHIFRSSMFATSRKIIRKKMGVLMHQSNLKRKIVTKANASSDSLCNSMYEALKMIYPEF